MRRPVTLMRGGEPLDVDTLEQGDEVTYLAKTGEVLQIKNAAGEVTYYIDRPPAGGKAAYMVAETRKQDDE